MNLLHIYRFLLKTNPFPVKVSCIASASLFAMKACCITRTLSIRSILMPGDLISLHELTEHHRLSLWFSFFFSDFSFSGISVHVNNSSMNSLHSYVCKKKKKIHTSDAL